ARAAPPSSIAMTISNTFIAASVLALRSSMIPARLQQLVRRDRQLPDASARGMEDGVGDRRRDPDHAELTHALDAERVDDRIVLLDEHRLDPMDVGVDGDVVVLEVRVHDPSVAVVDLGGLLQRHAEDRKSTRLNSSHVAISY